MKRFINDLEVEYTLLASEEQFNKMLKQKELLEFRLQQLHSFICPDIFTIYTTQEALNKIERILDVIELFNSPQEG